jgi:hypothetical protein
MPATSRRSRSPHGRQGGEAGEQPTSARRDARDRDGPRAGRSATSRSASCREASRRPAVPSPAGGALLSFERVRLSTYSSHARVEVSHQPACLRARSRDRAPFHDAGEPGAAERAAARHCTSWEGKSGRSHAAVAASRASSAGRPCAHPRHRAAAVADDLPRDARPERCRRNRTGWLVDRRPSLPRATAHSGRFFGLGT